MRPALRSLLPAASRAGFAPPLRRFLNVHEYVSMALMKEYDVPVPRSAVALTPDEAELAYSSKLGGGGAFFDLKYCFYSNAGPAHPGESCAVSSLINARNRCILPLSLPL